MSEVEAVVDGLSGTNAGLVFASLVLVGVFFLLICFGKFLKIIFDKFIESIISQLSNITLEIKNTNIELSKTRETLVGLQQQQINLEDRVEKIEGKFK